MKKVTLRFLTIAIIGLFTIFQANNLFSGSFQKLKGESTITVDKTVTEITEFISFQNTTMQTKNVKVKFMIEEITDGHEAAVCTYFCFPYTNVDWDSGNEFFPLEGGQTTDEAMFGSSISLHCQSHGVVGTTMVTYRFFDMNDTDDYIDFPIRFNFGVTSVDDLASDVNVIAYPNPTNGNLTVRSDMKHIASVSVFAIDGTEVLTSQNSNLNLSNFAAGKYIMRVQFADGTHTSQSVVVE